jgi:hypothetical protein
MASIMDWVMPIFHNPVSPTAQKNWRLDWYEVCHQQRKLPMGVGSQVSHQLNETMKNIDQNPSGYTQVRGQNCRGRLGKGRPTALNLQLRWA